MQQEASTPDAEQFMQDVRARCRRMLQERRPLREVLATLASAGEAIAGGRSVCSILLLDAQGLLRNGASPNLPADYLDAIDRIKPDPQVGTCAAAAATGHVVETPDFLEDGRWSELRHLPRALGFVGAWSQPIRSGTGEVLGTFGTYYRERRRPSPRERACVEELAGLAGHAVAAGKRP